MTKEILLAIVKYLVPLIMGYLISLLRNYSKKDKLSQKALMIMLQSNLTNTYYEYEKKKAVPEYIYQNWANEFKVYRELGGNSYVCELAKRTDDWKIVRANNLP